MTLILQSDDVADEELKFFSKFERRLSSQFRQFEIIANEETLGDDYQHPPYWWGERQTRIFVSAALSQVGQCYLVGEPPIDRRDRENGNRNGYADYYARYSFGQFLIELKQQWIGLKMNSRGDLAVSLFSLGRRRRAAIDQLRRTRAGADWAFPTRVELTLAPVMATIRDEEMLNLTADLHRQVAQRINEDLACKAIFFIRYLYHNAPFPKRQGGQFTVPGVYLICSSIPTGRVRQRAA